MSLECQNCRVLCLISEQEKSDFLPEPLWSELTQLVPGVHYVAPSTISNWNEFLRANPSDILIAAWDTPRLPEDIILQNKTQYICSLVGGMRNLVPRILLEKGVRVSNWGNSISRTVAEGALTLLLASHRRLAHWTMVMHAQKGWRPQTAVTQSLFERKIGIHGFGFVARELVSLLKPFTKTISAYSPWETDNLFKEHGVSRSKSLEELFSENEVIVEVAPLNSETRGSVTESLLRRIPPGGVFVNIGRGAVVDEAALVRVAKEGKIQVGLDVYEIEPLPENSPLRGLSNVVLVPHMGGPTQDRRRDSGALAIENIRRFLNGESLKSEINLEFYDRIT